MNLPPYNLLEPDTRNPLAVAGVVEKMHEECYPGVGCAYVRPVLLKIEGIFAGQWRDYQAMDTAYHDLEHTLQSTLCCLRIVAGHHRTGTRPIVGPRDFCIAFHAMLLHDIGYLKKRDDHEGTGAKFTLIHEPRGCEIAQDFLIEEGWEQADIDRVRSLILCTGPRSNLGGTRFGNPAHRFLGQAVCTADFLSQMSDPGYVQKLPDLYEEFAESYRANDVPEDKRQFKSVDELYRSTPVFWTEFVVPKLRVECEDVGRYLAQPYPDGVNPYLDQVSANIEAVKRIVSLSGGQLKDMAKHMG